MSEQVQQSPFFVRLAKRSEVDEIVALNQRAYIKSPVQNYLGGVTTEITTSPKDADRRKNQERYLKLVYRRAFLEARLTVVVHTSEEGEQKIVASSIWRLPARERSKINKGLLDVVSTELLILPIIWGWGVGFIKRAANLVSLINKGADGVYKERHMKESRDEQYYLGMVAVDPDFHGKGLMSLLFREAFDHAPSATFTLFANGVPARDRYTHWGFETWAETVIGKGECDENGLANPSGKGFLLYFMVKNPPKSSE
ncbi:hypothetical protein GYMLUDRAFT_266152 [Collybiopsis luxurians FD-317 M1]|uniref:Unplaced genomic scaffold GYMLUscaffold_153, whole genome shotgun sequence n=1 Tax=Collybiopsis luxurians FD-317 M1 TaxID=944289 RepID=A0A0D0AJW9_9AGAR|nr:hypothetical protein GYMLUDRAFT_266152 [Collybiopsis luxurians FD-317 M1]